MPVHTGVHVTVMRGACQGFLYTAMQVGHRVDGLTMAACCVTSTFATPSAADTTNQRPLWVQSSQELLTLGRDFK